MSKNPLISAKNSFFNAWKEVTKIMTQISGNIKIDPTTPSDIFRVIDLKSEVKIFIKVPIAFTIPERTKSKNQKVKQKSLIIVLSGRVSFEKHESSESLILTDSGKFKTKNFGTNVEYYRVIKGYKNRLKFLCSVHYDFEKDKLNHPVFHAQFNNKPKLIYDTTFSNFHINVPDDDIFQNFRIPSTQHDIFSTLVQLSGDHLLSDSDEAFEKLMAIRLISDFFVSADFKSELNTEPQCMRSIRFFPDLTL